MFNWKSVQINSSNVFTGGRKSVTACRWNPNQVTPLCAFSIPDSLNSVFMNWFIPSFFQIDDVSLEREHAIALNSKYGTIWPWIFFWKKIFILQHGLICWKRVFFRTLLLQALEARRMVLHKEQEMAFADAETAGFDNAHLLDLIEFSESFHVSRLRY